MASVPMSWPNATVDDKKYARDDHMGMLPQRADRRIIRGTATR
jgi:hypothetical protein